MMQLTQPADDDNTVDAQSIDDSDVHFEDKIRRLSLIDSSDCLEGTLSFKRQKVRQ
jgi:hypothetical protein